MKDHSVEGYLWRLSSEELEGFLLQCARRNQWSSYWHIVPKILEILHKRGYCVSGTILFSWKNYQQDAKKTEDCSTS